MENSIQMLQASTDRTDRKRPMNQAARRAHAAHLMKRAFLLLCSLDDAVTVADDISREHRDLFAEIERKCEGCGQVYGLQVLTRCSHCRRPHRRRQPEEATR